MYILISAATSFELEALQAQWPAGRYSSVMELAYLVTGIGPAAASMQLTLALSARKPDLLLNIGIAGSFDPSLQLGEVVLVTEDFFGDLGAESGDGEFLSLGDLKLPEDAALTQGRYRLKDCPSFATCVRGTTLSCAHGNQSSIERFNALYPDVQVESMEGAAAFMVATHLDVKLLQIRAISNYVEPRNRAAWQIEQALRNLTISINELLQAFPGAEAARSARQQLGL